MPKYSGKYIRYPGGYQAYIPDPLPPVINWDLSIINALSNANRLLGQLAGEGSKLPNPHILIRPFITKEAVLSSKIEGTQATLGDVLAAQAGAAVETDSRNLQEVNNYIIALEYGIERLKTLPISLRLIKEIHAKLMTGIYGSGHITPGEFRKSQNWIGTGGCTLTTATYIPPSPEYLIECLSALENFLYDTTLPVLIQVALIHYQFEAIHPFLDGNGRVGRLLIILFLIERKVLPAPLLYISAFFELTRKEYYARLLSVTKDGDWSGWLYYFLNGIAQQSEDAIFRSQRINSLLEIWHKQTENLSSSILSKLINELASNPFITINKVSESMQVSYTTVQRAIEKLEKLSIVHEISGGKRNRIYCAKDILTILEEPTNINL